MESVEKVLKAVLDAHAGDLQLLAVQLEASPVSVHRWVTGSAKPRPSYEAKLREIYAGLSSADAITRDSLAHYRVVPHHPMITEAVDETLKRIREILHKRAHLSSRSQALDELSKLLFAHVEETRHTGVGICSEVIAARGKSPALGLKAFVADRIKKSLPVSLAHQVELRDFELRLKPNEDQLASELIECFETLQRQTSSFNFSGFDVLNEVFGKFLADSFIDEKELGQYLTPPEVVRFMAGLAIGGLSDAEIDLLSDPYRCAEFGLILDPSCGVASFLAEFVQLLGESVWRRPNTDERKLWQMTMLERVVVGIDKSERMVRLALTNLAMFGLPMARLHLANSLARNGPDAKLAEGFVGKAKIILTNPPFGACFQGNDLVKYKIATRWSRRLPQRVDSEILFMERYLDWLAPGGQLVAIVPDSILTNKGIFEDLRKGIANEVELCSVTSLPNVTFGVAGTSTKTSVLHLRKKVGKSDRSWRTAFAVCQDVGFTVSTKASQRQKVVRGVGELPDILEEIVARPATLHYVRWREGAHEFDRWDAQHHASLSTEIEQRLDSQIEGDMYISDLANLVDERADPRRWGAKEFKYIEISDIDAHTCTIYENCVDITATPSRARKLVKAGDVLVSTVRPERGIVGVVGPHQDGSICTTGLAVLRPTSIDPLILAFLIKTDFVIAQLLRNNVGIAYPAINETCLPGVLLPIRKSDIQRLAGQAKQISDAEQHLYISRAAFKEAMADMSQEWRKLGFGESPRSHPGKRTTSRPQLRKGDSDSRGQETFQLVATRKA